MCLFSRHYLSGAPSTESTAIEPMMKRRFKQPNSSLDTRRLAVDIEKTRSTRGDFIRVSRVCVMHSAN